MLGWRVANYFRAHNQREHVDYCFNLVDYKLQSPKIAYNSTNCIWPSARLIFHSGNAFIFQIKFNRIKYVLSAHIITLKTGRPKCLSHLLVGTFFYYLSGAKLIWVPCPCRSARGIMFPNAKHEQHERAFINKTIKQKNYIIY